MAIYKSERLQFKLQILFKCLALSAILATSYFTCFDDLFRITLRALDWCRNHGFFILNHTVKYAEKTLPMSGTEVGSEVMKRIATPMVGGMISALVLTLLLLPVIFMIRESYRSK